ncbi:MAG: ATP-grasp domain-containing protein [Actinobacteria bacterium]|nr:ATP-grasp domain-containing protein [Actinomycetota bacterium]
MKTVLFLGAGRHQRAAILRAKELGYRVAAVDGNPDALALPDADIAEVVNFVEIPKAIEFAEKVKPDGVLTITSDRAVVAVAAVAEALGLPGIGVDVAVGLTHKVEMRRRLERAGIPQPRFGSARTPEEALAAAAHVRYPLVIKPADSGGQRGVFRIESDDELVERFPESLELSRGGEVIVEQFVEGTEMNAMAIVRDGEVIPLTLSDRHRPPGSGFAVGWIQAYPAALDAGGTERAEAMVGETLLALGLRNGIGFPQLIAHPDGRILMIEIAARIPGGQMADLVQHAVGVDLVEVALRFATGEPIPDELALPKFRQPVAIRFFTAQPGPLPTGRVKSEASLDRVLAAPGVVDAASYIVPGETIRPVQRDGDRRGYVVAIGATGPEALERSEQAAALVDVEVE